MPRGRQLQPQAETSSSFVPAGPDNNDIYHIPICNLKFDTVWQDVKDFLRGYADVLHIEIFSSSTSGWVKVQGSENFERAFERLNGGTLKGLNIIACDRNREQAIMIRDVIHNEEAARGSKSSWYKVPEHLRLKAQPQEYVTATERQSGSLVQMTLPLYHDPASQAYLSSMGYPMGAYAHPEAGTLMSDGSYSYVGPQAYGMPAMAYADELGAHGYYSAQAAHLGTTGSFGGNAVYMPTYGDTGNTPSGLLVSKLPRKKLDEAHLHEILEGLHIETAAMTDMCIVRDSSDQPDGSAVLYFDSLDAVSRAIGCLHGAQVAGNVLEAWLYQAEGPQALSGRHARRESEGAKKHSSKKEAPIVVDGSSSRYKKGEKPKRR